MAFSLVEARIFGSTLRLNWELAMGEVRAISIQVATDANFTRNYCHFVLPTKSSSVTLDLGAGGWYFRAGAWTGRDHVGSIEWSATYGPAEISTAKPTFVAPTPTVAILHHFAVPGGVRLQTSIGEKSVICVEVCKGGVGFEANNTTMTYMLNWGDGTVDVKGLDAVNSYGVRVSRFVSEYSEFPTAKLHCLARAAAVGPLRPLRVGRYGDGDRMAAARSGATMLREAAERPTMRFPTQAAYLRYLASKTGAGYH